MTTLKRTWNPSGPTGGGEYPLGDRLKHLRNLRKISQSQLAKDSKLSQATIAQIESGRKDPSVDSLHQIARALDIEVAALFTGNDIFVFDLRRLRRKYNHADKLPDSMYTALGRVIQYAKDIEFIKEG
jgi:transcriptional regulator with XRE-family HTH domain